MLNDEKERASIYPGWIDGPYALDILETMDIKPLFKKAIRELIVDGFTVINDAIDHHLCDQVIADYERWTSERADYVNHYRDVLGREARLVNFHLASESEMKIVTDAEIGSLTDLIFGETGSVYTTLTFKYGTQQPVHRDTPHFATWPKARFCGVWTALEDVEPSAGPLMYYKGGHRFEVDELQVYEQVRAANPDLSAAALIDQSLDVYNGRIIDLAPVHGEHRLSPIRKGDVVIWHANLPHGGSVAADPQRTRWSVVAHHAPLGVQVHQYPQFFTHQGPNPPPPKYGFFEAFGRNVGNSGETAFM